MDRAREAGPREALPNKVTDLKRTEGRQLPKNKSKNQTKNGTSFGALFGKMLGNFSGDFGNQFRPRIGPRGDKMRPRSP